MTKKEKRELAIQLKADLLLKSGFLKENVPIEEKQARNNRKRQSLQKAKMRKGNTGNGSKHKTPGKQDWDFDRW